VSTEYLDCYTRVSTAGQKTDGSSLIVQLDVGKRVAERLNLSFRHYDEGARSSTTQYRDVLERLKDDITRGQVKNIWCLERSRMFRDSTDAVIFRREYLEKFGVRLFEGELGAEVRFDDASDMLAYDLLSRFQEYDNKVRLERSQRGKIERLRRGEGTNVFLGGTPLFGYKNIDKHWRVDANEASWVRKIFDHYEETLSLRSVKSFLEKNGIESRRGRSGLWNLATLYNMLTNKTYTGIHEIYVKKIDKRFTLKVDKIISVSQFNRVQKLIVRHSARKNQGNQKHETLLGEFLRCSCNTRLGSEVKKTARADGVQVVTKKYFCMSRNYQWRDGVDRGCLNKKSLNMDATDTAILDRVKKVVSDSVLLKEEVKREVLDRKKNVESDFAAQRIRLEEKCQRIQRTIESTENQIVELEVDAGLGKRDKNIALKIVRRYEEELERQHQEYASVEKELEALDDNLGWIDWIDKFSEKIDLSTRGIVKQRDFLRGLIDEIVVKAEMGEDRDGRAVQIGHSFDILFKIRIVNDKLVYHDKSRKSAGYVIKRGRRDLSTGIIEQVTAKAGRRSLKKSA
jgi:hypothetical protein